MAKEQPEVNYIRHLNAVLELMANDEKITPFHVSLYMALFASWNRNRFRNPISIHRDEIMFLSKIRSNKTYVNCMQQLHEFGFIQYDPSFNHLQGTRVHLCTKETAGKQLDMYDLFTKDTAATQHTYIYNKTYINNKTKEREQNEHTQNQKLKNSSYEFLIKNENLESSETKPAFTEKIQLTTSPSLRERHKREFVSEPSAVGSGDEVFQPPPKVEVRGLSQIKSYFKSENWPEAEAEKFFNYYESNGWLIGGKTPMKNWKASAIRWMQNSKIFNSSKNEKPNKLSSDPNKDYSEPL